MRETDLAALVRIVRVVATVRTLIEHHAPESGVPVPEFRPRPIAGLGYRRPRAYHHGMLRSWVVAVVVLCSPPARADRVNVVLPDGRTVSVEREVAERANLRLETYEEASERAREDANRAHYCCGKEEAIAAVEGFFSGLTFGATAHFADDEPTRARRHYAAGTWSTGETFGQLALLTLAIFLLLRWFGPAARKKVGPAQPAGPPRVLSPADAQAHLARAFVQHVAQHAERIVSAAEEAIRLAAEQGRIGATVPIPPADVASARVAEAAIDAAVLQLRAAGWAVTHDGAALDISTPTE